MPYIIHKEFSYKIRGILIDIYNKLGPRLPEKFYQQAITHGLKQQGITCEPEKQFEVIYRNQSAGKFYLDHYLENGKIILEIKVASTITPIHQAQTISYLKLTDADLAIIVNFGTTSLQDQRLPNFIKNKNTEFQWQSEPLAKNILYPELTNTILKIMHKVHFTLGPGFIHRIYRNAVMIELQYQDIAYEHIRKIPIYYNNILLGQQETQLIKVENQILLGIFAIKEIDKVMFLTMKARMKHLGLEVGFLANFYEEQVVVERVYNVG